MLNLILFNFGTIFVFIRIMNLAKIHIVRKVLLIVFFAIALITCIDPYYPQLKGYESLLVVDGLITNEDASNIIKLSRSKQNRDDSTEMVSDATVYITDDEETRINLKNCGFGIYKTDSSEFTGMIGRTYILHVITGDGNEYESDPCFMSSVPGIDSVYYEKHEVPVTNLEDGNTGILISLDSEPGDEKQFYRWSYKETWKFKIPIPVRYVYVRETLIYEIPVVKEYCFKNRVSDEILINRVNFGQDPHLKEVPIKFIATDKSDRVSLLYSIQVKQYSISEKEYKFWSDLQMVNESGGDIFESQPFSVVSNIHNLNDPDERILGYFQVSAAKEKRIFISPHDITWMDLPIYHYPCEIVARNPGDYPPPFNTTFDEIYLMFCVWDDEYVFVEPIYFAGTFILNRLAFTKKECANCEWTGTSEIPDFWIDIDDP
jgi:hypothetical protein